MKYITFDENNFNFLIVSGIEHVFCVQKDFSVFPIQDSNPWSEMLSWEEEDVLTKGGEFTILYSLCPYEICGLYAVVAELFHKQCSIFVTCAPDRNAAGVPTIGYGDYTPEEVVLLSSMNRHMLSRLEQAEMRTHWQALMRQQGNLRIWDGQELITAPEDYFDSDILAEREYENRDEWMNRVQMRLRQKYHIGLNIRYIQWRIGKIEKKS